MPDGDQLLSASIGYLQNAGSIFQGILEILSIFGGGSDCPNKLQAAQLVAAREQGLARQLSAQLAATINGLQYVRQELAAAIKGSNYRQEEVDACNRERTYVVQELAAAQRELANRQRKIDGLQNELNQCQAAYRQCAQALNQCNQLLNNWRTAFPGIGPKHVALLLSQFETDTRDLTQQLQRLQAQYDACQKQLRGCASSCAAELRDCRAANQTLTLERAQLAAQTRDLSVEITNLRQQVAQLSSQLTNCQQALSACQQKTGDVSTCLIRLRQCGDTITQLRQVIVRLQNEHTRDVEYIREISVQYRNCQTGYTSISRQLQQCKSQLTQSCPPLTCERLKALHGTCRA